MRPASRPLLALPSLLAWALAAHAQPAFEPVDDGSRPRAASRITASFDFDLATPNPVPDQWVRVHEPAGGPSGSAAGFPTTNLAEIDTSVFEGGRASVKLPTRGGNTRLSLIHGAVPVFTDTDYRVTARVRTSGLRHAAAGIIARLLDSAGNVIPGTQRRGTMVRSEGVWTTVLVDVNSTPPAAAFLQIDLVLLQPADLGGTHLGPFTVWPQDLAGAAWFDTVEIMQLARIGLETQSPDNAIVAPQKPELKALVRDLTGEDLTIRVRVIDAAGTVVADSEADIGAGNSTTRIVPTIRKFGWYRASLIVLSKHQPVGFSSVDFVYLPPLPPDLAKGRLPRDAARLGVLLEDLPDGVVPLVPRLASLLGCGSVTIPVWSTATTAADSEIHAKRLTPMVEALHAQLRDITFWLPEVPQVLQSAKSDKGGGDRTDVLRALAQPRAKWWPLLVPWLDLYGQSVPNWLVGSPRGTAAAFHAGADAELAALSRALQDAVASPGLFLGTSPESCPPPGKSADARARGAVSMITADLPAATAGDLARAWREAGGNLTLVFERADPALHGLDAAPDELIKHAVHAWRGGTTPQGGVRLWIQQPWTTRADPFQLAPRPELAAWSTLSRILTDRIIVGEFPAGPGLVCYILAPAPGAPDDRGAALVLWSEQDDLTDPALDAYLGAGPITVCDRFGNTTILRPAAGSPVRVKAGRSPVFIEGIDTELVRLLSSIRLTPPSILPVTTRQDIALEFENPWSRSISGKIRILGPGETDPTPPPSDRLWTIQPRTAPFTAGAGERVSVPVSVAFGSLEEAGPKVLTCEIEVTADAQYAPIRMRIPIAVELSNLRMTLSAWTSPNGIDTVVEAQVTNLGEQTASIELTAFAPKRPRSTATIGSLLPGHQIARRFIFRDTASLKAQRVLVSLIEPDSGARVNHSIEIP